MKPQQHWITSICILIYLFTSGYAPAQNFTWANEVSGIAAEEPIASATDNNGNTIVAGIYSSPSMTIGTTTLSNANDNQTFFDIYLIKYDPSGNVLWAKTAGSPQHDYPRDLALDANGNIYMTGYFGDLAVFDDLVLEAAENFVSEAFLVKYNPDGEIQWLKQSQRMVFGSNPVTMTVDPAGNAYVCGGTLLDNINIFGLDYVDQGDYDAYIIKLDSDGNVLWLKEFWYDANAGSNHGLSIKEITMSTDGNRFCIGGNFTGVFDFGGLVDTSRVYFTNMNPSIDLFTACYDIDGGLIWYNRHGAYEFGGTNKTHGIGMDADDNTYITGVLGGIMYFENGDSIFVNNSGFNDKELFLIKYNSLGEMQWVEQVYAQNSNADIEPAGLAVSTNGNCYLTGYYEWDPLFGNIEVAIQTHASFIAKYNTQGQAQWVKVADATLGSEGIDIGIDADQNVYSTGHYTSSVTFDNHNLPNGNLRGTYVVQIAADPNTVYDPGLSSKWSLYPNPSNDFINLEINYESPQKQQIMVFNVLGKPVQHQAITDNRKALDISKLSPGTYFLRLQFDESFSIKKFIKL